MEKNNTWFSDRNETIGVIFLLLLYTAFFIYITIDPYKEIGWSDYYSWINVAQKYADGHFKEALNAYWSPLMPWLLIPFVKFNLFVNKEVWVINFFAGLILFRFSFIIARQFSLTGFSKWLLILGVYIISMSLQVLYYDGSDFISAVCLIVYLTMITSDALRTNVKHFLVCIPVAMLCMFGKSFYGYFVLSHLIGLIGYHYYLRRKKEVSVALPNLLKTFVGVIFIFGIWVSLLSWKYERFMISSAGKFNFSIMTPVAIKDDSNSLLGLLPPPDEYSYYSWVDATYFPVKERKVFDSKESFDFQVGVWKYNWKIVVYTFSYYTYLKVFVLLLIIPSFFLRNKRATERILIYYISSFMIMGGYFMLFIEERYFMGVHLLMFLFSFLSVVLFLKEREEAWKRRWITSAVAFLIFVSFAKIGYFSLKTWFNIDREFTGRFFAYEKEVAHLPFMKNTKFAITTTQSPIGSMVGYDFFRIAGAKNYGGFKRNDTAEEQYAQLKKYDIDYYFHFGCFDGCEAEYCLDVELPFYLEGKVPVYTSTKYGVRVYAMKPYR